MQMKDLRPVSDFAIQYGCKSIIYGPPGSGKTPLLATAPRPLLLATEPGLLSMRGQSIPTWQADTSPKIKEFFDWFLKSAETKNFDTLCVDSSSQMCDIELKQAETGNKHGLAAYGVMGETVLGYLSSLYYFRNMHIVLLAKEETAAMGVASRKRPYYPGKFLPINVPHLFDNIWHLDLVNIPNVVGAQKALRTRDSFDVTARTRAGNLNEFEPPNLSQIFAKVMST